MDINPRAPRQLLHCTPTTIYLSIYPITDVHSSIFIVSIFKFVRSSPIHSIQWLKLSPPTTLSSGQEEWEWHSSTLCLQRLPPL